MSFVLEAILSFLEKLAVSYIAKRDATRKQQEIANADAKRDTMSDADVANSLRKYDR
jgi:hypothetical protein